MKEEALGLALLFVPLLSYLKKLVSLFNWYIYNVNQTPR